tara:strand:- start:514 stop:780 length:267 start_codon:yes stop_codon:yes gene_type:complete
MTPEYYAFIGIVGTCSVGFLAWTIWAGIKSYISEQIDLCRLDIQRDTKEEISDLARTVDDNYDTSWREMNDNVEEIYRKIDEVENSKS